MDAIQMTLQHLYFNISPELLINIFKPMLRGITLDEAIRHDIIDGKVLNDINLVGGAKTTIPLKAENAVYCPPPTPTYGLDVGQYAIYRIPPQDREYRNIVSIQGVRYPYNFNSYGGMNQPFTNGMGGVTMGSLASAVLNAQTFANSYPTPIAKPLQGDMVQLIPPQMTHMDWVIECRLEWDRNFTSMDPTTIHSFIDLVYTAVRGYIYTMGIFESSRTFLSAGQELNVMKEMIEEGKQYLEQYPEKLRLFCGATLLSRDEMGSLLAFML